MRVILHDDAFQAPYSALLCAIFMMGVQGRHHIGLSPALSVSGAEGQRRSRESSKNPHFWAWWDQLPQDAQRTILRALSPERQRPEVRKHTIHVTQSAHGASTTGSRHLPNDTLFELLTTTLTIYMENALNDPLILQRWCDEQARATLKEAEERGWLRFAHGNGITGMIELASRARDVARTRLYFICDRDAAYPDRSTTCDRVINACEAHDPTIAYHVWRRRMIENYLPQDLLKRFPDYYGVETKGLSASSYQDQLSRRDQMSEEDRHAQDLKRDLHPKIAELFKWHDRDIMRCWPRWQQDDPDAHQEIQALLAQIFERM